MKRILHAILLAAVALSLNSCGLPMALGRTVGRAVGGVANLAGGGN